MTRARDYGEHLAFASGLVTGVLGTACLTMQFDALVYLLRVAGVALLAVGLAAGAVWVTWTALAWARGGRR